MYIQYVIQSYVDGNYYHKNIVCTEYSTVQIPANVPYKPIMCMYEDILPLTGFDAVKS